MMSRLGRNLCFACVSVLLVSSLGCNKPRATPVSPPPPRPAPAPADQPPTPSPTASISASPSSIDRGEQTTLSWETQNASAILIDQGIGNVNARGSIVVSPNDSTTYTIVARGGGGDARASTRVTIVEPRRLEPVVSLSDAEGFRREIEAGNVQDVFFEFDKADLSTMSQARLDRNAEIFKRYPQAKVIIEGHCDERGTEEYNLALGDRRALATYQFLVSRGVASSQLETISYGEERPFDPGHTESAWAQNRRAHFVAGN